MLTPEQIDAIQTAVRQCGVIEMCDTCDSWEDSFKCGLFWFNDVTIHSTHSVKVVESEKEKIPVGLCENKK